MPSFPFSQALTANQLGYNPLSGWQYEFVPWPAYVRLLTNATTTGVRLAVFSGSDSIQQRAPVQGGGTAGVMPSQLNTSAIEWIAAPGDRIILQYDEVAGGTPTVNGTVEITPAG